MVETIGKVAKDLAEQTKNIKEYIPSFFKEEKLPEKGTENIFEPVVRKKTDGFTDYQIEHLSEEYGLSETEIAQYFGWDDFEARGLNKTQDITNTVVTDDSNPNIEAASQSDVDGPDVNEENEKKEGLTEEEKEKIKEETGWSDDIIDCIENMEQYEIYKNADLHEAIIDGRKCLVKDIDMDYVDPKTGLTNRELMSKGRSPIDAKTGEKIELHHMGQDFDSPFAELCENSEHGDGNHKTLHPKMENSWRNDMDLKNQYNNEEKPNHWIERSKEGE